MIPLLITAHLVTFVQKRLRKRRTLSLETQKLTEHNLALVRLRPHLTFDAKTRRKLDTLSFRPLTFLFRAADGRAQGGVGEANHEVIDVISLSAVPRLKLWMIHLRLFTWQGLLRVNILQKPLERLAFELFT